MHPEPPTSSSQSAPSPFGPLATSCASSDSIGRRRRRRGHNTLPADAATTPRRLTPPTRGLCRPRRPRRETVIPGANFAFRHTTSATRSHRVSSSTAWQEFGANIDGKVTTTTSTDVSRSRPRVEADAGRRIGGIDNSWARTILPSSSRSSGPASSRATTTPSPRRLHDDDRRDRSDDSGTQSGQTPGLVSRAVLGHPPTWTSPTTGPSTRLLNDGGSRASKIAFPQRASTAASGRAARRRTCRSSWVSGPSASSSSSTTRGELHARDADDGRHRTVRHPLHAGVPRHARQRRQGALHVAVQRLRVRLDRRADHRGRGHRPHGTNTAGVPSTRSPSARFDGVQIGPLDSVTFRTSRCRNILPEAGED